MRFYFIPAWYNTSRPWYDNTEVWYRGSTLNQFDDTINQLKMFDYAGETSELLVMNYMPNLRYFTHRYDLFEVPTWSLFDTIQGIKTTKQRLVDFKDLHWPQGVEFIYTPFLAIARFKKQVIAYIEFGEDGQLIWINMLTQGQVDKRYIFDDRGFVSSILYFKNGREHHQDYLNQSGQWQIREFLLEHDHHVDVAEEQQHRFSKAHYQSIDELVKEVMLLKLVKQERPNDVLVIASHPLHNDLLLGAKGRRKVILSYYQKRTALSQSRVVLEQLSQADLIVADTQSGADQLASYGVPDVTHLSLFDTRLQLGKSQRLKEQIIYFVVDDIPEEDLREYLSDIFFAMSRNDNINLSFISYDWDGQRREARRALLEEILAEEDEPYLYFAEEDEATMFEVVEDDEEILPRVRFKHLGSELEVQKVLETARLIIDLRDEPDLYTQIAGISAGIPQVNKIASEFVEHLKNGYIVTDDADLFIALDYYLTELVNWNKALVYAVRKIEAYTSGRLVKNLIRTLAYHE